MTACEICQQGNTEPFDRGDERCPRCDRRANGRGGRQ